MPSLGPSRVHFKPPWAISHTLTTPSKLPDASNCPSALNDKLDTESWWPTQEMFEKIQDVNRCIHMIGRMVTT